MIWRKVFPNHYGTLYANKLAMKKLQIITCFIAVAVCGFFATGVTGWANTISITFNSPTGTLGTSQSYLVSGVHLTAYGYDSGGASALYGKNDGGDEVGLGLANDPHGNHEIIKGSFVQLDISQLKGYTSAQIFVGSTQGADEPWDFFVSNTLGTLGAMAISGSTADYPNGVDISSWLGFEYVGVSAHRTTGPGDQNVLLSGISATSPQRVPDSGTSIGFLSIGLAMLLIGRWKINAGANS